MQNIRRPCRQRENSRSGTWKVGNQIFSVHIGAPVVLGIWKPIPKSVAVLVNHLNYCMTWMKHLGNLPLADCKVILNDLKSLSIHFEAPSCSNCAEKSCNLSFAPGNAILGWDDRRNQGATCGMGWQRSMSMVDIVDSQSLLQRVANISWC